MTENEFKGQLVQTLRTVGHVAIVENVAETGTLDLNYALTAYEVVHQGWIETKLIKSGWLWFEKFQIPWMKRRLRATKGNHVWVFALDPKDMIMRMIPAQLIIDAPRVPDRKWVKIQLSSIPAYIGINFPASADQLVQTLTESYVFTSDHNNIQSSIREES